MREQRPQTEPTVHSEPYCLLQIKSFRDILFAVDAGKSSFRQAFKIFKGNRFLHKNCDLKSAKANKYIRKDYLSTNIDISVLLMFIRR